MTFDLNRLPSQAGRIFIVTGANAGLGFETTKQLAATGATVVMACRNTQKATAAKQTIEQAAPGARLEVMALDLGDLASVRRFAAAFRERHTHLDVLINNAGALLVRQGRTADGFETQFGTNYLGHVLLTSLLLDLMPDTPRSRVVTLTSNTHKWYTLNFDDLQSTQKYSRGTAYGRSKLANLMFAVELHRLLQADGRRILSVSAHPGMSVGTGVRRDGVLRRLLTTVTAPLNNPIPEAAKPSILAALGPDIRGGDYIGPQGPLNFKGAPGRSQPADHALNENDNRRLWTIAGQLTGATWQF